MAKVRMKKGSVARRARDRVAESLKKRGRGIRSAFALATFISQRAGAAGRKRLARRGLRKKKR